MITKFKIFQSLKEELLFNLEEKNIGIYINPVTTKRFDEHSRGFATIDGDLYLIDDGWFYVHNSLLKILKDKGYLKYPIETLWYDINETLKYLVPIQKSGKSDIFYLSESVGYNDIVDNYNNIINIFKKVKEKNPQYKFIVYPADANPDDEYYIKYNKFYLEI